MIVTRYFLEHHVAADKKGGDRRVNKPVREAAQKWFDALREHLAADAAQTDVTERLKSWKTIEDLMADRPALLPAIFVMAWRLRDQPAFVELFKSPDGKPVEDTTKPIAPSGKSYDDIVLAQLQGAMRVYCFRQEQAWLAIEKDRHKPSGLATVAWLAPFLHLFKQPEDQLANYPQRGLYLTVKPFLRHTSQFALIEALAQLPTSIASILGRTIVGLNVDASIRNLGALESRKCKFVAELAFLLAKTLVDEAAAAKAAGTPPPNPGFAPEPVPENSPEIAGRALAHLAVDGLHLAKAAILHRDHARAVVTKMSVPMGYAMWTVFADGDAVANIAACPAPLAKIIGAEAARAQRKSSDALNSLPSPAHIDAAVAALHAAGGREGLVAWTVSAACVSAWGRLAAEIKQLDQKAGKGGLSADAVAAQCKALAPLFAGLALEVPPPAAVPPAEAAPAEAAKA
jgi:hypothetical protein